MAFGTVSVDLIPNLRQPTLKKGTGEDHMGRRLLCLRCMAIGTVSVNLSPNLRQPTLKKGTGEAHMGRIDFLARIVNEPSHCDTHLFLLLAECVWAEVTPCFLDGCHTFLFRVIVTLADTSCKGTEHTHIQQVTRRVFRRLANK